MNEFYSYERFIESVNNLTNQIKSSKIKYDLIVGNARGGIFLADSLSRKLGVKYTICHKSYRDSDLFCSSNLIDPFQESSKKYLFVDDLIDSGETVKQLRSDVHIDVCVLLYNENAKVPNRLFYVDKYKPGIWIDFFWEKY